MLDRLFALIAVLMLAGFCGFLVFYVKRIDLSIVVGVCLLMAAYDLLYHSFRNKNGGKG